MPWTDPQKRRDATKNRRAKRREAGLCACGREREDAAFKLCRQCRARKNSGRRGPQKAREGEGACLRCGREPEPGRRRCGECLAFCRRVQSNRAARLSAAGCCVRCGAALADDPYPLATGSKHSHCGKCNFKRFARCRGAKPIPWQQLAELFEAQGGRCALSGRPLFLNKNASIDHKVPRASGGRHAISNVQFLDLNVNLAKRALAESEYLRLCFDVVRAQLKKSGLTSIHFGEG